jgi:DNA-directed RNA polymerase subunit RPC12/RpoP
MYRIITEGINKFQTQCPRCGCKFEYSLNYLNKDNTVTCPYCKSYAIYHKPDFDKMTEVPNE